MLRLERPDATGVLHHLMCRGTEREEIFLGAKDWKNFITRLIELDEPFNQKKGFEKKNYI